VFREVGRRLALRRNVTLLDPGSGANPFVAGIDDGFEFLIGQYSLR
jgi:hypothetical protein